MQCRGSQQQSCVCAPAAHQHCRLVCSPLQGRSLVLGSFGLMCPPPCHPFCITTDGPAWGAESCPLAGPPGLLPDCLLSVGSGFCVSAACTAAPVQPLVLQLAACRWCGVVWCVLAAHWRVTICSRHALQDNLSCYMSHCQAYVLGRLQVRAVAAHTAQEPWCHHTHLPGCLFGVLWRAMCVVLNGCWCFCCGAAQAAPVLYCTSVLQQCMLVNSASACTFVACLASGVGSPGCWTGSATDMLFSKQ